MTAIQADWRVGSQRTLPLVTLVVTLGLWLAAMPSAAAHGVIERSDPPANATLAAPPRQVVLWFNEPVDPSFSTVAVLDRDGKRVGDRPAISGNGRQFIIGVNVGTRGVYTVKWRVLSTVDGHATAGAFAFAVGEPAPSDPGTTSVAGPEPIRVVVRWIGLFAAVLLAGTAFFHVGALLPGLAKLDAPASPIGEALSTRLRSMTVMAAVAVLASVAVEFVLQATALFDTSLRQVIAGGMLWPLLGGTKVGWSVLVRAGMAFLLLLPRSPGGRILQAGGLIWLIVVGGLAALFGGPAALAGSIHMFLVALVAVVYGVLIVAMALILPQVPDIRVPEFSGVAPLAGAGLLAGITITAHASGSGLFAAIADWVHLLAVAVWIGGLASLLLVLNTAARPDRGRLSQALVPRFSTMAGISLGVLVVTGVYSAWLYVPSLQALAITPYGRTLLLKLLFVVPLVALGALNRFVFRPRLAAAASSQPVVLRRFLRSATGEVTLGVVVLLVVAVLTITPPAKVTMPAAAQKPLILAGLAEGVQVRLTITPAVPGWNRLAVVIGGGDGQPGLAEGRVFVRLTKLDENLDPTTVRLTDQGQGRHVAEGGELGLPGWWEMEVVLRRRGVPDIATSFPLRLGKRAVSPSDPAAVRLLEEAEQAMSRVSAWRQVEQITDGSGGTVLVSYEFLRPDRLRYRASSGDEGVIIGATRFRRNDSGPWQQDALPQPLAVEGVREYLRGAEALVRGRNTECADEPCQVLLWEAPGRTAAFAGWIGAGTRRVHRVMMVAPSHYMTLWATDFNLPLRIVPPQ